MELNPENDGVTNRRALQWPRDRFGSLLKLRREGVQAVVNVRGNREKHEALMLTLGTLMQYAETRYNNPAQPVFSVSADDVEPAVIAAEFTAPAEPVVEPIAAPALPTEEDVAAALAAITGAK